MLSSSSVVVMGLGGRGTGIRPRGPQATTELLRLKGLIKLAKTRSQFEAKRQSKLQTSSYR